MMGREPKGARVILWIAFGWFAACGSAAIDAGPDRGLADPVVSSPRASARTLVFGGWHGVRVERGTEVVLRRAGRLEREGAVEKALRLLDRCIRECPRSASLRGARAAIYFTQGFDRAAEHDFEVAATLDPADAGTWLALARVRDRLGLENAAEEARAQARTLAGAVDLTLADSTDAPGGR